MIHLMHVQCTPECTCMSTCTADLTRPDLTRPDPSLLLTSATCPNPLFGTEASTRARSKRTGIHAHRTNAASGAVQPPPKEHPMTTEHTPQPADVARTAPNSPPMDPEPTPTPIGRLSEQEREALAAAIRTMHQAAEDARNRAERIVRAHAERAWDEGALAARDEAGWLCSRSSNCAVVPEEHNPYRQEADQ